MRTNKGNTWIVVLVVVVLALGAWWLYSRSQADVNTGDEQTNGATGKVYYSITDAAANMGDVTALDMTVSKVEMHSEAQGWVTVSSQIKTFSLLELKAKSESKLAAMADVAAGTYGQVRVTVDSVSVTTKDGKTRTAKVPSGEIRMMSTVSVNSGETTSVNLDFLADVSLHTTGKGDYIFAPVVKVESSNQATVEVSTDDALSLTSGSVSSSATFGMDVSGEVRENFKLDTNAELEIDTESKIKLLGPVPGGPAGTSLEQNGALKIDVQ